MEDMFVIRSKKGKTHDISICKCMSLYCSILLYILLLYNTGCQIYTLYFIKAGVLMI